MTVLVKSLAPRQLVWLCDLLKVLIVRDLKLRYKRSVLGPTWSLLNPLAYLLVLHFVFGALMPLGIPRYRSFLFTGLLVWGWFTSSLTWSAGALADHRDLIQRPGFPPAILLPVRVLSDLIHFLLALPVLLVFLYFDGSPPSSAALALPLLIGLQFLLTLGPSYLVAAFHARYQDTQYLLGILLQLLFFLTPIFYDIGIIPNRYRPLYELNPLARLIGAYRAVLIHGTLPDSASLGLLIGVSGAFLLLGGWVFARAQRRLLEEL